MHASRWDRFGQGFGPSDKSHGYPVLPLIGDVMSLSAKFQSLAAQWAEHCRRVAFSSNMADYLNHPSYRGLVELGPPALPLIIQRYRTDDLHWGFVLQDITGVVMADPAGSFCLAEIRARWLAW